LPNEKDEAGADLIPSKYDFLGKGIDYGFRIGKNSRADFMTVSPALASILCVANTSREYAKHHFDLRFEGTGPFKGVLNGERYPIIGINTERSDERRKLNERERRLARDSNLDSEELDDYLSQFLAFHKIEKPALRVKPTDREVQLPKILYRILYSCVA
jgi:hypothetical protein